VREGEPESEREGREIAEKEGEDAALAGNAKGEEWE
jgi:hypothetical protein